MDLMDARLIVEILSRGTLTRAGEALGLSQPTVSRRVKRMEHELGVTLFSRRGLGVLPTAQGRALGRFAREMMSGWAALLAHLAEDETPHPLLVAASTVPGHGLVPDWLARFTVLQPWFRPRLTVMDSGKVEDAVEGGRAAIGFMGRPLRHGSRLRARVIGEDEIVVIAPEGLLSPTADGSVAPSDVVGVPFVWRASGSGTRDTVERALAQHLDLSDIKVAMEVDTTAALLTAVHAGVGAAFISSATLGRHELVGMDTRVLSGLSLRRALIMIWDEEILRRRVGAAAFKTFVEAMWAGGEGGAASGESALPSDGSGP